jgi:hypothetical protein
MKRLLALPIALVCTTSFALPIAWEPFNYPYSPPNTNLVGHSTLDGFTWSQAGPTTGGTNVPSITPGNLSYPGLAAGYGNSAAFGGIDSGGMAARFSLHSTVKTNSLYFSFLLKITDTTALSTTAQGVFWAGFNNTAGSQANLPTVVFSRVYTTTNSTGGYLIGIAKNPASAADVAYDPNPHQVGDTLFIVGTYDFVDGLGGTMDTSRMWVNPDSSYFGGTEPPAPLSTSAGNNLTVGNGGINSFCLFNRNASEPHGIIVDQLVLGTTWADVTPTNVPLAITAQPRNQLAIAGGHASFSVSTFNAASFQWQHNGSPVTGATQISLNLTNIQPSDAGSYNVVVGNGASTFVTSSNATLTVFPDIYPRLAPLWSLAPGSRAYLTTDAPNTPNQRGIAYNTLSNQLLLVSRTNTVTSSTNPAVYVLNGDTGADLYQMNVDPAVVSGGVNNNSISLNYIDVAADGAVIAGNVGDNSTANFELYYWTNSESATEPVRVWNGDPSGQGSQRFGDSFAVRGAGANTQVMLDNGTGVFGALLMPTAGHDITEPDSWTGNGAGGYGWFANPAGGNTGGRTLLFYGTENTFWEKHGGGNLNLLSYDITANTGTILTNIPNIPGSPTLVAFNAATNVLAAIVFASSTNVPDTLDQYDLSDPTQPLYIHSYNFPVNHQGNANGCGRVIFSGDRVYALDSNNGLTAWRLVPVLHTTPEAPDLVLSWSAETPGYTLMASPSLSSPTTWTNVSIGTLVGNQYFVTNPLSVGSLFYRLQK